MGVRDIAAALQGDRNAALKMAHSLLRDKRETLDELQATIDEQHEQNWDAEARRRECYNGEYDPETAVNALSQLYQQVLRVTHLLPLTLLADDGERQEFESRLIDNCYDLAVMVSNPTIRYAIIAGFDEEIRPEIDEYMRMVGRETWGTIYTLTESGEINWSDFPDDTGGILQDVARSVQEQQQQQQGGQTDD